MEGGPFQSYSLGRGEDRCSDVHYRPIKQYMDRGNKIDLIVWVQFCMVYCTQT